MAGTTNLQQWNPTAVNQETDAQYTADSTRAGGAVDPTVFLSLLGNKAFYQWSTYLTALFTAFANKGFTTSDSNLSTLTAQCANFLTTADTLPPIQAVVYAPTPTFNAGAASGFQMTLAGNVTGITITGAAPGELIAFYFVQDATGGRTVNGWPSYVDAGSIPQPDPVANSCTLYLFKVDLTGGIHPAAPVISGDGTRVTNLTASGNVTVAGNEVIGGTLGVTGTLTAAGNIAAAGVIATNTQTNNNAAINGTATVGTLVVTGATTTGSLHVAGGVALDSGATVTGSINTNGVNVTGGISATGSTTSGSLHVTGSVALDDGATITGTIITNAIAVTTGGVTVTGTVNAGALQVAGAAPSGEVLIGNGTDFVATALPRAQGVVNVVTGSRTNNTTYHNTSGGIMLISGAFSTDGGGGLVGNIGVLIGASSPTTVVFANQATATENLGDAGFYGAVPNGWFYSVNISSGVTGPVHYWVETIIS